MKPIASTVLAVCLSAALFAKPPVPRPAGDFRMLDSSGKTIQLSHYRGQVVVLQFLYTTCSHCQATARMLSRLQTDLGPQGLRILGVAFNPEAQDQLAVVGKFSTTNDVSFPVGAATPETVFKYLGVSLIERFVVPQIVVVDRSGVIRAQSDFSGTPELQDETYLRSLLAGLLKAPHPRSPSL